MHPLTLKQTELFWSRVRKGDGCWVWSGLLDKNGYGLFPARAPKGVRRTRFAHRIAFELVRGAIERGLHACHTCDTPACVNPDHIFLGTQADNMHDMGRKGRRKQEGWWKKRGVLPPRAKFNWEQVREIRRRHAGGESQRGLARAFGVSRGGIRLITTGGGWREAQT